MWYLPLALAVVVAPAARAQTPAMGDTTHKARPMMADTGMMHHRGMMMSDSARMHCRQAMHGDSMMGHGGRMMG
ncbi:MAG TPA: hypothetical protein VFS07_01330, partial [Gemmatimonadales bacterium]|nr:hypothetical protein [Gemmatimonadales bacterium]